MKQLIRVLERLNPAYILIFVLAVLAAWLSATYQLVDSTISDSIGYTQAGRQLAQGDGLAYIDPHNAIGRRYYTLYAFKVMRPESANLFFGFPPGLPAIFAAVGKVVVDSVAIYVVPVLFAVLLVVAATWMGVLLFGSWTGFWAGLILLTMPVFLTFATSIWSEVPGTALLYMGLALCLIAFRRERDDGSAAGLAVLSGLLIGVAFFVRYSIISVFAALPLTLWYVSGRRRFLQRRVAIFFAILALALLSVFVFNNYYYGGPLTTNYSPIHGWYNQPAMSLKYAFGPSFVDGYSIPALLNALLTDFGWLLLFIPVALVLRSRQVGPVASDNRQMLAVDAGQPHGVPLLRYRDTIWLAALFLSMLVPYLFYAFSATGLNARFVIPAWVIICIFVARGITSLGNHLPSGPTRWLLGLVLIAAVAYTIPGDLDILEKRNADAAATVDRARRISALTEHDAIILSYTLNDLVAVYGDRSVLNYRHIPTYDPAADAYNYPQFADLLVLEVERLISQGTPVYYVLDLEPSLYDSYEILDRHFSLERVVEDEPLFRIGVQ